MPALPPRALLSSCPSASQQPNPLSHSCWLFNFLSAFLQGKSRLFTHVPILYCHAAPVQAVLAVAFTLLLDSRSVITFSVSTASPSQCWTGLTMFYKAVFQYFILQGSSHSACSRLQPLFRFLLCLRCAHQLQQIKGKHDAGTQPNCKISRSLPKRSHPRRLHPSSGQSAQSPHACCSCCRSTFLCCPAAPEPVRTGILRLAASPSSKALITIALKKK